LDPLFRLTRSGIKSSSGRGDIWYLLSLPHLLSNATIDKVAAILATNVDIGI